MPDEHTLLLDRRRPEDLKVSSGQGGLHSVPGIHDAAAFSNAERLNACQHAQAAQTRHDWHLLEPMRATSEEHRLIATKSDDADTETDRLDDST